MLSIGWQMPRVRVSMSRTAHDHPTSPRVRVSFLVYGPITSRCGELVWHRSPAVAIQLTTPSVAATGPGALGLMRVCRS